jgi:hypothetical protein
MSLGDLKSSIYRSLRDKGVVNNIKAQARSQLVLDLNLQTRVLPSTSPSDRDTGRRRRWNDMATHTLTPTLHEKLVGNLIANHLKQMRMVHTLSVFIPECQLGGNDILSETDMLELMRCDPTSALYAYLVDGVQADTTAIANKENERLGSPDQGGGGQSGFLCAADDGGGLAASSLLVRIFEQTARLFNAKRVTVSTQTTTDTPKDHAQNLAERLERVDTDYLQRCEAEQSNSLGKSVEEHMIQYQRQCEERLKTEVHNQVESWKERDLRLMEARMQEKSSAEIQKIQRTLDAEYQDKLHNLRKKEKELNRTYEKKERELEEQLFSQRQELLQEMGTLRSQKEESRRQLAQEMAQLRQKEQAVVQLENSARKLELDAARAREASQLSIDLEIEAAKKMLEASYAKREADLRIQEDDVAAKSLKHKVLLDECKVHKDALDATKTRLADAEEALKRTQRREQQLQHDLQETQAEKTRHEKVGVEFSGRITAIQLEKDALAKGHSLVLEEERHVWARDMEHAVHQERKQWLRKADSWEEEKRTLMVQLNISSENADRLERKHDDDDLDNKSLRREVMSLRDLLQQARNGLDALDPSMGRLNRHHPTGDRTAPSSSSQPPYGAYSHMGGMAPPWMQYQMSPWMPPQDAHGHGAGTAAGYPPPPPSFHHSGFRGGGQVQGMAHGGGHGGTSSSSYPAATTSTPPPPPSSHDVVQSHSPAMFQVEVPAEKTAATQQLQVKAATPSPGPSFLPSSFSFLPLPHFLFPFLPSSRTAAAGGDGCPPQGQRRQHETHGARSPAHAPKRRKTAPPAAADAAARRPSQAAVRAG